MKPFLQFRLWIRRGPLSERVLAGVSAVLLIGLLSWAIIPSLSRGSGSGSAVSVNSGATDSGPTGASATGKATTNGAAGTSSGTSASVGGVSSGVQLAAGSTAGGATTGSSGSSSAASGTSTGSAANGGGGPGGTGSEAVAPCGALASTAKGVTATQISVGVLLPDAGPVNAYVGIPSQADFHTAYNAIFAYFNKLGGVQCRKMVPTYYDDDVLDSSSEQATCLQAVQDGVFAVLNNLDTPEETGCIAQHDVPNIWYTPAHNPDVREFYPYLLSDAPNYDRLIYNYVTGAQTEGFFKGMKKLGILEESCFPDENTDIAADLKAIGITSFVTYNYGCPVAVDVPNQDQEAALQFQQAGVTNVLNTAYTYITNFSQAAQTQDYYPRMAIMEDGALGAIYHESDPPPPSSFNGTLGITWDQIGAESTPGVPLSPSTATCASIMSTLNFPPPTEKGAAAGALYGDGCAIVAVFVAAADHDQPLLRTGLAAGMVGAGQMQLSYPVGPMDVTNTDDPTGGEYWRADTWSSTCGCWHVTDPNWHR